MNFNEFSQIVEEIKTKNPVWFYLDSDPIGTIEELTKLESQLAVSLPMEYKQYIGNFGGGYFAFTNIFSVKDGEWNIVEHNAKIDLINSHSFIAVSDNEVGDYYGFEINNGVCNPIIKFYNHENNQIEHTPYKNLYEYLLKIGLNQKSLT